ncbi:MAG: chalcone isomerase family protein [Pseudobdellovibrio sp.]
MLVRLNYFNLMGLLLSVLFSTNAFSSDSEEFKFPNETVVESEKLILNGQAIRKMTVFNIKVMIVGLYLKTKSDNSEQILLSKTLKQIQIRFLSGEFH